MGTDLDSRGAMGDIVLAAAKEGDLDRLRSGLRLLMKQALGVAAANGRMEVVQYLVEGGSGEVSEADGDDVYDVGGKTPLYFAAENGHSKIVQYLVEHGMNTDAANRSLQTALHFAAEYGHLEVVQYLVQ